MAVKLIKCQYLCEKTIQFSGPIIDNLKILTNRLNTVSVKLPK